MPSKTAVKATDPEGESGIETTRFIVLETVVYRCMRPTLQSCSRLLTNSTTKSCWVCLNHSVHSKYCISGFRFRGTFFLTKQKTSVRWEQNGVPNTTDIYVAYPPSNNSSRHPDIHWQFPSVRGLRRRYYQSTFRYSLQGLVNMSSVVNGF